MYDGVIVFSYAFQSEGALLLLIWNLGVTAIRTNFLNVGK